MTKQSDVVVNLEFDRINKEASDWVVRLEEEDLSAEEQASFQQWLAKSDRHRETFDRISSLWGDFDGVAEFEDIAASDEMSALVAQDAGRRKWPTLGRRSILTGIAASIVFLVGAAVIFQASNGRFEQDESEIRTAVGEQRTIVLADGSEVLLNTDTEITVNFDDSGRNIQLLRGEAHFDVKPDAERPFSVYSGDRVVRAVGTAFTVRLLETEIDVTVTEGRVAIFSDSTSADNAPGAVSAPIAQLEAGGSARFDETVEHLEQIEPDELARKLSWREGVLAFSGDPLADVISDVGRYTDIEIVIDDPEIAAMPVNGYFKIGEVDEMFEALEIMAGLRAERVGPRRVRFVNAREG